MRNIMVIINPKSGNGTAESLKSLCVEHLSDFFDNIAVRVTGTAQDPARFGKEAAENEFDSVMIVGGDGTVNGVIQGFSGFEKRPKVAIVPAGTGNLLTRAFGVSQVKKVAITSYKFDKTKKLNMGFCNDQVFNMFASLGPVSSAIHNVSNKQKSAFGMFAYLWTSIEKLQNSEIHHLRITSDDQVFEGSVDHLMVSLTDRIGTWVFTELTDVVEQGKANLFILESNEFKDRFETMAKAIGGKVEDSQAIKNLAGSKITIEMISDENHHIDLDGEKGPITPVKIEIIKDSNEFYLPEN